ncbi:MAG: hypothetical protein ACXWC9_06320 [Pseudobdellovibrionaceae bacterium]
MKKTFMLLMALFSIQVMGGTDSASVKVDLELKLQEKLKSLIAPLDPQAQVLVNIKTRPISTDLPGMNMAISNFDPVDIKTGLHFDDINKIEIKIYSQLTTIPQQVKTLVESAITIHPDKKDIQYLTFDTETIQSLESAQQATPMSLLLRETSKLAQFIDGSKGGIQSQLSWSLILLGALVLFFGFMGTSLIVVLRLVRLTLKEGLSGLAAKISEGPENPRSRDVIDVNSISHRTASAALPAPASQDHAQLSSLPTSSVLALFSDAYWCEQDAYASWLWQQMANEQKISVLENLSFGPTYANWLTTIDPVCKMKFHLYPYYLQPLPAHEVSQEDLLPLLKQQPSLWHFLSPIRKADFKVSISERISFQSSPVIHELPPFPNASAEKRKFASSSQSVQLTQTEDDSIFLHPEVIPVAMRKDFLSLAWVALLSHEEKQKLFLSFSASELAECWTSSETILSNLAESLSEKKLKLVLDLQKRVNPSRESASYKSLVLQALDILGSREFSGQHHHAA